MGMSDPIADMLTRIRNANTAKHDTVDVPASKMKVAIAQILQESIQLLDHRRRRDRHARLKPVEEHRTPRRHRRRLRRHDDRRLAVAAPPHQTSHAMQELREIVRAAFARTVQEQDQRHAVRRRVGDRRHEETVGKRRTAAARVGGGHRKGRQIVGTIGTEAARGDKHRENGQHP